MRVPIARDTICSLPIHRLFCQRVDPVHDNRDRLRPRLLPCVSWPCQDEESLAVRRYIVRPEPAPHGVEREQRLRHTGSERRPVAVHWNRDHAIGTGADATRKKEDLPSVAAPSRDVATAVRDLILSDGARKRRDVDLVAPRLVGGVRDPSSIGGKSSVFLVEWRGEKGPRLPCAVERKDPDIAAQGPALSRTRRLGLEEDELPIGRP